MEESLDPHLRNPSMSVALPAIPSLHLGQMHGERLHLGELMLVLWCPVMCPAVVQQCCTYVD